ncbi:DUF4190 domain-containing protein [Candidatus Woesearchaeota archaeon]|nr:DUF4190 domain-containing protein [Candidatus Woesearchaeota archaeon]
MKKSKSIAIASFAFGMTFWIPLLNLIFGLFAVIFGFKALSNIKKNPEDYSGKWFAITGIALGAIVYIGYATGLGICFSGYKGICESMGITFLS